MPFIKLFVRPLVLTLIVLCASTHSIAERRERLIDEWRPIHYEVSLTLNEKLSTVSSARAEISVLVLKDEVASISLDFGEMPVDSISVDGVPGRYSQKPGTLTVSLASTPKKGERFKIVIAYHGKPKDGLIFAADKDGTPSVVGDNWPNRVHHWLPSFDHPSAKATVRFTVTAPARNLVVANGRHESTRTNPDNTRTWVWSEAVPISPYCMIIAVGNFAFLEPKDQAITPLSYYVPQSDRRFAMQGFAPAAPSLKFFSETVGSYPYEKLAMIVGATRFGGMENSSAIIFGADLFKDFKTRHPRSRIYDIPSGIRDVVTHEVAHQWFGDSVTEATWADLWLSEGFATYFAGLFIERFEGKEEFQAHMKSIGDTYFAYKAGHKTPIHDKDTEDLNALLNANNYDKGAWVLHMLRGVTGDKAFFQGLREYYARHRDSTATTEDLRQAMEKTSGLDLKEFFTRWVYKSGHPSYEVAWRWSPLGNSSKNGFLELNIRQVQEGEPFLDSLIVDIKTDDGVQRVTLNPKSKNVTERIPVSSRPTSIVVDPEQLLLKEIRYMRKG